MLLFDVDDSFVRMANPVPGGHLREWPSAGKAWRCRVSGLLRVLRTVTGYCAFPALLYAVTTGLSAGDLTELRVTEKEGVYHMKVVVRIAAPAEHVRAVLTDYARIYRLNPAITESQVLQSPEPGVARVRTVTQGCIGFFCREIVRVEDVRELPSGDLQAVIVPGSGSFRSGAAEWDIDESGQGARITYQAQMEPDFFIPPLIGSYFVKRNIRNELIRSFARLECIGAVQARMDRDLHAAGFSPEPAPGVAEC